MWTGLNHVMLLRFSKMHGLGNDFIVIDAINQHVELSPQLVRRLADRHFGVGCDQLLLVEAAQQPGADFRYRIFNADGSEVAQCGNGARCFARFVRERGLIDRDTINVETMNGMLALQIEDGGLVRVDMGVPQFEPEDIPMLVAARADHYDVDIDGRQLTVGAVSMGNPHVVIRVDDVMQAPVTELGPLLEQHRLFPERANVGFMEVIDSTRIRLRVYERGTGETLACGSGACAAVCVGSQQGLLAERVLVELPGGSLFVQWAGDGQSVIMTGPASFVFEGEIAL